MHIRQLTIQDAQPLFELWLRALQEHPTAYVSNYADTRERGPAIFEQRLSGDDPMNVTLGAFIDETLVGMCAVFREPARVRWHKANLVSVYVIPEARGQGAGRALCEGAIREAQAMRGVEELLIGVTVGNDTARALYLSLGFEPYAIEPRATRFDGVFYDHELMTLRWVD